MFVLLSVLFWMDSSLVAVFTETGHGRAQIDAVDVPAWVTLKLSLSNSCTHLSSSVPGECNMRGSTDIIGSARG